MHFPDLPYILTIDEDDYDLEPFLNFEPEL